MEVKERNPIVFIPGLMGSMGDDIIHGTGSWGFGVAAMIYNPFIKGLESIGYKLGKDLFICFYDWRKSNKDSAREYLVPIIENIKKRYKYKKIDIICHSMGGLVARTYIQHYYYRHDIDKLIMIATPNKGAVDAYYFWSQGNLFRGKDRKRGFQQILSRGYMWLLQRLMNFSLGYENIDQIHNMFPSVKELIPSYDYGPFMSYRNNDEIITIPTFYTKYRNDFLDRLNYWAHLLSYGTQNTYCIVGDGYSTGQYILIDKESYMYGLKEQIVDIINTEHGDRTVTSNSAQLDGISYYMLKGNHHKIVEFSLRPIFDIYNLKQEDLKHIGSEVKEDNFIQLLLDGRANVHIVNKINNEVLVRIISDTVYTKYDYVYERYNLDCRWLILKDVPKGEYYIDIKELELSEVNVLIMTEYDDSEYSTLINKKNKTLEIQVF